MELKETTKPKKSIFNAFLAKRSTKVEPHSVEERNGTRFNIDEILHEQSSSHHQHPLQTSVSANSTPIKRLYKIGKLNRLWHCHGSNLSLTSNHSIPSHFLRKTSHNTNKRIANTKDRHSHPISSTHNVFYATDNSSSNDDSIKRSKSHNPNQKQNHTNAATVNNNTLSMHHNRSIEQFDNDIPKLGVSKSQEQIIVNDIDENFLCDSSKQRSPSSKSHDGNFPWNRNELDYPEGHSIAMSACRSRLREKLLPPGYVHKIQQANEQFSNEQQQNSSFSNISNNNNKGDRSSAMEQPNARSYSCDIQQNAKRSGRAESLAKNSLMAAQLINLIPTEVARERSYLANNLAVNSLLGPAELDRILPLREIRVFVGTWNMNEQHPPKQMNDFVFPAGVEHVPDLVVIGTQESCSERFEWEVILQETLGPSHVMLHATSLGTLHLAVFIRRDLIWFCSIPEDDCLSVRPGTAFRTKGAVAISFCLFGTSMLFVTSHLTAHQQKVKERVSDVKRIIHALDLPKNLHLRSKNKDVTQNFDAVFWCGDLNFRLGEPREKLLKWIETTQFPLPSHLPHGYMHTDQLKSVLANGAAFKDFKEANITFPPTYKYDPGTQNFDTSSKRRAPAYTDRILFKYKSNPFGLRRESNITSFLHSAMVECISYDSVPSIVSSDHKPVWALFKTCIKPGIDSIPLAGGLFNREVYIEGMKRRLTKKHTESTNACCIQ